MATMHQIRQFIEQFKGLEKRKSDLIDKPGFFSTLTNAKLRSSGALSKRRGFATLHEDKGALGIASYRGKSQYELLAIDENLSVFNKTEIIFSTILDKTLVISLLPNEEGNLIFTVRDAITGNFQEINLGDGLASTTNVTDISINDLSVALSSLPADLAMSINSTSSHPAAFIEPFDTEFIKGDSVNTVDTFSSHFYQSSQVTNGDVSYAPFSQTWAQKQGGTYINPISTAIANNVIYFGSGYDEIMKYDGSKIYRAGLPTPTGASASLIEFNVNQNSSVFTGPNNNTSVYYMVVYKYTDAQGNTIRSNPSEPFTPGNDNTHDHHFIKVNLPSLQPGSGFDINNSNLQIEIYRTSVPISDSDKYAYNYYKLTDANLPTQTVSMSNTDFAAIVQGAVNFTSTNILNANAISNNSSGGDYFVDYLGNDDNLTIAAGEEDITLNDFIVPGDYPEGRHDLPPKGAYVTIHQGSLVISGNINYPTEVNYSLPDFNTVTGEIGNEYFTPANNVIIDGVAGGPITGVKSLQDSLYIFHENTISYLTGDITTPGVQALRKDVVSKQGEIGAFSNSSIQELEGNLLFIADEGIHSISKSLAYPKELSQVIKPLLNNKQLERSKSVSFFSADDDIIGFCIPVEGLDPVIYVLDINVNAWIEWDNIDMSGGVVRHDKETFFISRSGANVGLHKIKSRGDKSDYSDHNKAIDFVAITAWDSLGNASLFKKYLRLKVFITDTNSEFEGDAFKLQLYLRKNFTGFEYGPIELDSGSIGGWGQNSWGEFFWGSQGQEGIVTKLLGKAKSLALHFENNTINENILISGTAIEIASPYQPEIKE
jgi:hypothetical protein